MKVTELKNLLQEFWKENPSLKPLKEVEILEKEFQKFVEQKMNQSSFEDASTFMMKWLSENQHPHTMVETTSNSSILWEGQKSIINDEFLID